MDELNHKELEVLRHALADALSHQWLNWGRYDLSRESLIAEGKPELAAGTQAMADAAYSRIKQYQYLAMLIDKKLSDN